MFEKLYKYGKHKGIFLQDSILNYLLSKKIDELDDTNLKMYMIERKRNEKGCVTIHDIVRNENDDVESDSVAIINNVTVLQSCGGNIQTK